MNVFALFWLCKAALPLMPKGGSILTTASIQATHPSPSLLDYAPTKAAILAFTRALARQVAKDAIRVNCARSCLDAAADKWRTARQEDSRFRHPDAHETARPTC